jgi:DNA-binding PadR family transcriptional regulator
VPAARYLPLSPQQFEILLALTDRDLHGYGLIADVAERTGGRVRLGTGALYTAVARLAHLGLIAETDQRDADDARRRYYRISRMGRAVLEAEVTRLDASLASAREKGVAARAEKGRA